jgi:hypothetical protein
MKSDIFFFSGGVCGDEIYREIVRWLISKGINFKITT